MRNLALPDAKDNNLDIFCLIESARCFVNSVADRKGMKETTLLTQKD
jgi:hypothetical protein